MLSSWAGQLGEVLEESARIALSWVRAHAPALGLPGGAACPSRKWDVHIHLPAGEWLIAWHLEETGTACWLPPLREAFGGTVEVDAQPDQLLLLPRGAGAVPKDGPSAGITLAVALVSLFTERCVRPDVAMTGDSTLRLCAAVVACTPAPAMCRHTGVSQ
jgi:ATP-dependent Lon protease